MCSIPFFPPVFLTEIEGRYLKPFKCRFDCPYGAVTIVANA